MKIKTIGIILVLLTSVGLAVGGTNDVTSLVQKGLFEEEANHHLDAAMEYYREAIGSFDKDRRLAATAIFHLGECYRLQGKTAEANEQYQRVLREFPDQTELVDASRGYLPKGGSASPGPTQPAVAEAGGTENPDEKNDIRRIKDMIQNSPDLINGLNFNPLVQAAREGWMSAAKLLIENGANVNPPTPSGSGAPTPLGEAAHEGNKGMVEFLLSKGANPNALDAAYAYSPLDYAVDKGFKSVAEALLDHGADVNFPDGRKDCPLHFAANHGFITVAELLLAHKADVNARGGDGETPLFPAIQNHHIDMVKLLIANKADVNVINAHGGTPLRFAMSWDSGPSTAELLIDSGADVEQMVGGHDPLASAVNDGRADLVELLLKKKANPNIVGKWNVFVLSSIRSGGNYDRTITPLILAVSKNQGGYSKLPGLLLQYKADPNIADETGKTALDYAIGEADTNLIADLIAHYADVNAMDKNGDPPLAYVTRFVDEDKRWPIKTMLIQAGANEDYVRQGAVFLAQKGTGSIGNKIFSKDTNSVNRYTLFDLISKVYSAGQPIMFPDLAHVTINRLKPNWSKEEITVDLEAILKAGDCLKNPPLEWGDIVLVPQSDHGINDFWQGLDQSDRIAIGKCLLRKVTIIVKGQENHLVLLPSIVQRYVIGNGGSSVQDAGVSSLVSGSEKVLYTFDLDQVVHEANVLLISSDLTRVKVTGIRPAPGGQPAVMVFNLETAAQDTERPRFGYPSPLRLPGRRQAVQSSNGIQLQDGDVIEIPELPK